MNKYLGCPYTESCGDPVQDHIQALMQNQLIMLFLSQYNTISAIFHMK